MAAQHVSIDGPQHRARITWVAAASLFITSAALLAVRSMPSNLTGEALSGLTWSVTISFALACLFAAIACWRSALTTKSAAVATALFGLWVLIAPLLLNIVAADGMLLADALVKIIVGGVAAISVLRSGLASPWRALPAVVFGVVIAGTLLTQLTLSSPAMMETAVFGGNVLLLAKIGASLVLSIVSLRFSRIPKTSIPIL